MEKVIFLVEESQLQIQCLLNPEHLQIQRDAGMKPQRGPSGLSSGLATQDQPLLFTGGGQTQLHMELLFDTQISGWAEQGADVRGLTQPLWDLAEKPSTEKSVSAPPKVRFVWGKAWNLVGYIRRVQQKLENFDAGGTPRRSWMQLAMQVFSEEDSTTEKADLPQSLPEDWREACENVDPEMSAVHIVQGAGRGEESWTESLIDIAIRYYGFAHMWRLIAQFNEVEKPHDLGAGDSLVIPPMSEWERLQCVP